jgi:hypothetical protein
MEQWIPLIQSLIWPLVLGAMLIWLRGPVVRVVSAVARRIDNGEVLDISSKGIKLGPSSAPVVPTPGTAGFVGEAVSSMLAEKTTTPEFYLVHTAKRDRRLDHDGAEYFRLRIWLDADEPNMLDRIQSVTYLLHSTFRDPVRVVTDRKTSFELRTVAWGEFNLHAEIKFKDGNDVSVLERYLNLPA